MNRRKFISSLAASSGMVLAGCTGSGMTHEQAPGSALNIQTKDEGRRKNIYRGTVNLNKGQWGAFQIWSRSGFDLEWSVDVMEGGSFDILVMSKDQMSKFREGKEVSYSTGVSKLGIKSASASGTMPYGKHRILFENSGAYKTTPEGSVKLNFEIVQSV